LNVREEKQNIKNYFHGPQGSYGFDILRVA
jgi:hypothetical protein